MNTPFQITRRENNTATTTTTTRVMILLPLLVNEHALAASSHEIQNIVNPNKENIIKNFKMCQSTL